MQESEEMLVLEMLDDLEGQAINYLYLLENAITNDSNIIGSVDQSETFKGNYEEMIFSLYQNLNFQKTNVPISTLTNVIKQVVAGPGHLGEAVAFLNMETVDDVNEKTPIG